MSNGDGVAEVRGPELSPTQAWSLLAMAVLSLVMTGVTSALLGAMVDEHRLTASGLGYVATLEALTMAAAVGIASATLKARRLRLIGIVVTAALIAANLATLGASGAALYWIRGAAGIAEGVMLWLGWSMIIRTPTPERWAALLFLALSILQLAISAILAASVLPLWGADGGYMLIAVITAAGFIFALLSPDRLGELPGTREKSSGIPPVRGWLGLLAAVLYTGATAAVSVYLVALGQAAGLSVSSARFALSAALGAQILGSMLAAVVAGRVGYLRVFLATTIAYLAVWGFYALPSTAWPFIAVTAFSGLVAMFVPPFIVPMLIDADKTRRAALQAPGAQLLSGGLGPFAAAWAVENGGMDAMLGMAAALLAGGMAIIVGLALTAKPAMTKADGIVD